MISVCLTTYNGQKYVKQQLESILSQLSVNDEVIVSDDGSSDDTLRIIENINDSRVKIYNNILRNGVINNVENALNNVSGEIIFLSDQDDVWLPAKVTSTIKALQNADLIVSDCYIVDENLNLLHESFFAVNNSKKNKYFAILKNPYLGCCMAFRRELLGIALPFPENISMHDIWLGNVAAFKMKVAFLPEKLIYYRRHGKNLSSASEPSRNSLGEKIKIRIDLMKQLYKL